jgi:hypothetical protein
MEPGQLQIRISWSILVVVFSIRPRSHILIRVGIMPTFRIFVIKVVIALIVSEVIVCHSILVAVLTVGSGCA